MTRSLSRSRWISAAWIVGVWLFVGILQATQRYLRGRELEPNSWAFWSALGENLVLAALWAAATPLVMRLARRWPFPGRSWPVLLAVHVPMGAAVVLLHTVVSHVVYKLLIAPGVSWADLLANTVHSAIVTGASRFATYVEIVGVTWGLDEYRGWREKEIRASNLQAQLASERLESLKLQLHPEFLFQTLALLRSKIRSDPAAAAKTIVALGELLRLSLKNGGRRLVRLAEELRYADLYLKIESTRLSRELPLSTRVPRGELDAAVPSLVLQPLVEAAVAAAGSGPACVEVSAVQSDGRMTLRVRADSNGGSPGPSGASNDAIARAARRLDLEYPGAHRLEWSSLAREAVVEIPFAPLESAS
ncbi:MAG TPA: histidine kinase [Thermoanaerobaculia bacterium]|nr:histidine kinase [Thermoanaerobaculia bacterium]